MSTCIYTYTHVYHICMCLGCTEPYIVLSHFATCRTPCPVAGGTVTAAGNSAPPAAACCWSLTQLSSRIVRKPEKIINKNGVVVHKKVQELKKSE